MGKKETREKKWVKRDECEGSVLLREQRELRGRWRR